MGIGIHPLIKDFPLAARISLAISSGYLFSLSSTYLLASLTEKVDSYLWLVFFFFSLPGLAIWLVTKIKDGKQFWQFDPSTLKRLENLKRVHLVAPLLVVIIPVLIPLSRFSKNSNFSPTFTQGNNDVAQFVLGAEAVKRGGFHGDGFLANQDLFVFARDGDFGAPNFLLWASKFNFSRTWSSVTPSISALNLLLFLALLSAFILRFQSSHKKISLIALSATSGAIVLYLDANIFLSQLIAMWLWGNILLIFTELIRDSDLQNKRRYLFLVGLNLSAIFFTYPHMAVITLGIFILSIFFLRLMLAKTRLNANAKSYNKENTPTVDLSIFEYTLLPILVIAIACNLYLFHGLKLFLYRANADNGWPMPNGFSIANILLVGDFWGGTQRALEIVTVLLIAILIVREVKLQKKKKTNHVYNIELFIWILFPIGLYALLSLIYGHASYKAWKVAFSFGPFVVADVLSKYYLSPRKTGYLKNPSLYLFVGILVIVPMLRQSIPLVENRELYKNRISSADLYDLEYDLSTYELTSLNIQLTPFFESMYAAAIVKVPSVFIAVPSYAPILINQRTCTLVRTEDLEDLSLNKIESRAVNGTYSLIDYPSKCAFSTDKS